jgi:hypothetical protein
MDSMIVPTALVTCQQEWLMRNFADAGKTSLDEGEATLLEKLHQETYYNVSSG